MNVLTGEITLIKASGNMSMVTINVHNILFKTIVIETPSTVHYLRVGNKIKVMFKETEVVIGKGTEHFVSLQNRVVGSIADIQNGELLSRLTVETAAGNIVAIISFDALEQLDLRPGEKITAMIKTNEIMLSE